MRSGRILLISMFLVLAVSASAGAVPMPASEHVSGLHRDSTQRQDACHLVYYNLCSQWAFYWMSYCRNPFYNAPLPPQYGVCFDLQDCPDPINCASLYDVWFALKRFACRGRIDIEVYCSDDYCCPIGPPLAGIYDYSVPVQEPWQHFIFDGLCVYGPCLSQKFIVLITDPWFGVITAPYSDMNSRNISAGCESEWRCTGHSYIYRNAIDYCAQYGTPGPLWVSGAGYGCTNHPGIPPGCHDYSYPTGFFTEFLIDAHVDCLGATAAEQSSWSEIKGLYK